MKRDPPALRAVAAVDAIRSSGRCSVISALHVLSRPPISACHTRWVSSSDGPLSLPRWNLETSSNCVDSLYAVGAVRPPRRLLDGCHMDPPRRFSPFRGASEMPPGVSVKRAPGPGGYSPTRPAWPRRDLESRRPPEVARFVEQLRLIQQQYVTPSPRGGVARQELTPSSVALSEDTAGRARLRRMPHSRGGLPPSRRKDGHPPTPCRPPGRGDRARERSALPISRGA